MKILIIIFICIVLIIALFCVAVVIRDIIIEDKGRKKNKQKVIDSSSNDKDLNSDTSLLNEETKEDSITNKVNDEENLNDTSKNENKNLF